MPPAVHCILDGMYARSDHRSRLPRRGIGERINRAFGVVSRALPIFGLVAIVLAVSAVVVEGSPIPPSELGPRLLGGSLFVLSCFVGSYMPVEGQPDVPSVLSMGAMTLALLTSLGGVALAVLSLFAREIWLALASARSSRVVVIGDGADAAALVARLRSEGRTVVSVGASADAMIRIVERADVPRDRRLRRVVSGSSAVFILYESSVDGALASAELRSVRGAPTVFQQFDWRLDRLVFREAIRDGAFPTREVFSPIELTGIHIAHLIAHLVRLRRQVVQVYVFGGHQALEILIERLTFMEDVLAFCGGVEFVPSQAEADVVVLGVDQHEYIQAVEDNAGSGRIVFAIAPERYFSAVGRTDLGAVSSASWLNERDRHGGVQWDSRVVLVDESRLGYDLTEVSLGLRGRWAREFHNAHSDFGARSSASVGSPNRWLDRPPHPRLVAMAGAAVDLMVKELDAAGYDLIVRSGPHDSLRPNEVEVCARHIHEQYLSLTWLDDRGVRRRCAEFHVDPDGALVSAVPPPPWALDSAEGRERNRAMVREVYPALAATFGYRITRSGRTDADSQ